MQFEIRVKDNKVRQITAARLMSAQVLSGIGAMLLLLQPTEKAWSSVMLAAGIFLLIFTLRSKKEKPQSALQLPLRIAEIGLCAAFIIYAIGKGFTIPAVIVGISLCSLAFALIMERNTQKFSTVKISDKGISRPLVFKHAKVNWPEIDQVLLRFGTLTINCDGNRFYQYSIDNYNFNTAEFESFCINHINEGKSKRKNNSNDW
jgi:hypothetical protein